MRGYPISSFLFWELQEKNYDKWEHIRSFKKQGREERTIPLLI